MSSADADADVTPAPVRAAFALFAGAVAISVVNAVLQVAFHVSPLLVLANPVLEALLFLGIGARMRAGSRSARNALLGVAGLFIALNLAYTFGLTTAVGQQPTALLVILLVLVTAKVALIAAAVWMMFRPESQGYLR